MAFSFSRNQEYNQGKLLEEEMSVEPLEQFRLWLDEAMTAQLKEPLAMTLATATPSGRPSARMVLLRGYDARGFTFFTNYDSRKGAEIAANPWGALVFYWATLERQIRIEGSIAKIEPAESDEYFVGRPQSSRLGAWASPQSAVIPSRQYLEERVAALDACYPDGKIPRPPEWGGYRLCPESMEFWQGQPSRLHDRILYRRAPEVGWVRERLAP